MLYMSFLKGKLAVRKQVKLFWLLGNIKTSPTKTSSWYSRYGRVWRFLEKLKIEPPYNSAIPLLGIYPKKPKTLI